MMEEEEFDETTRCARELGDRLSDAQLLEVADLFHEMLRRRRALGVLRRYADAETRSFALV